MNMKLFAEKFEGVLSEEDLGTIESLIKDMVKEQVDIRVEAETDRLTEEADKFCEIQIAEKVQLAEEEMAKDYEEKLDIVESTVVKKLDKFLDNEICEKISDDLLKTIAINETYAPIIAGIQDLFENKFVALDSEGEGVLKEAQERIAELEEQNIELVNSKIELAESNEVAAIKLLVSENSVDLTDSEREKLTVLVEGKSFEELEGKISTFVDMATESSDDLVTEDEETEEGTDCITEGEIGNPDKDKDDAQVKAFDYIETLL